MQIQQGELRDHGFVNKAETIPLTSCGEGHYQGADMTAKCTYILLGRNKSKDVDSSLLLTLH